jgi:hypothetical protein
MPYITQVAKGKLEKLRVFGNDYPTALREGLIKNIKTRARKKMVKR